MKEDVPTVSTGDAIAGTKGDVTWAKPLRKIVKRMILGDKTTNEGVIKNIAKATVKGAVGAVADVAKKEFENATGSIGSSFLKHFTKSYPKKGAKK